MKEALFLLLYVLSVEFRQLLSSELQWLTVGREKNRPSVITKRWCNNVSILAPEQRKKCKQYKSSMVAVVSASRMIVRECQEQLRDRDWNCTVSDTKRLFMPKLRQGSKESAFLHALSSSAVAFTLTKYCSGGMIPECGCDQRWNEIAPKHDSFEWSGCSDNIAWGVEFSKAFVNAWDISRKTPTIIERNVPDSRPIRHRLKKIWTNVRNNEVGRNILSTQMKRQCVCHGVTGSCEVTTCWRSLPTFSYVSSILKRKYDSAVQVKVENHGGDHIFSPRTTRVKLDKTDLVYLKKTEKLCDTAGRECEPYSRGLGSCESLCCGRGFKLRTKNVSSRCQCRFMWCCEVVCNTCDKTVVTNVCR